MAADPSVSPADTIRRVLTSLGLIRYGRFERPQAQEGLAALDALLAVGERDKAEIEALTAAVEGLLDVGTRSRSGDPSLDPEEWYAIRDYAQNVLKDGGTATALRESRERDRRQIAQLTDRADWRLKQIEGCIDYAAQLEVATDFGIARGLLRDLRDARAVLADEEDAP